MEKMLHKYKKTLLIIMILAIAMSLTACGSAVQTVKSGEMEIKISKEYKASSLANATWYYTSPDSIAMGIRSSKEDIEKSGLEVNSLQDYVEAYIKANDIPKDTEVVSTESYEYFEYKRKVSGIMYSYITCAYDSSDAYWLVSFACYKEMYNDYRTDFLEAADSVKFTNRE